MDIPSFIEDHISQIPALKLLMNLGYTYITPVEALEMRGNRSSNVLLEAVLKEQLPKINSIQYKGKEFLFSESNISSAIIALRDLPVQDGFLAANRAFYDLITLGKSLEQNVLGDKKSFTFQYIDWKNPENNKFHITEEYSVLRAGRNDHYRPDIILFVNGIPIVVIECKSPAIKEPGSKAVEQHLRNQQDDGIRSLYHYSNLVINLAVNEARYATTGTPKEFWNVWKEIFNSKEEGITFNEKLIALKNKELSSDDSSILFKDRYKVVLEYFKNLHSEEQHITEQDKLLYCLCRHERLLDLIFNFIVYDEGIKKIARYRQYFAIKKTMIRITTPVSKIKNSASLLPKSNNSDFLLLSGEGGRRPDEVVARQGGVIWHTQGSGKSLTMVLLAQQIAISPLIKNPKIILVTDRIDLDDQITDTFKKCHIPVENAKTGRHLVELLRSKSDAVITTIINKFEAAVNQQTTGFKSAEIFVLVDEGHRSQYGTFNVKMRKIFPNACFIAFTGTPLMKKEKSTAAKFGGIIDIYSINDAVADKAVVPLLYEGRHNLINVNEKPLDTFFDKVAEPLSDYGKASLKRKFSTTNQLNKADQVVYARAWNISEHYEANFQNTGFKGQLATPDKKTAIRYKEYFDEIGKVVSEVLISSPDMREGEEDAFTKVDDKVKAFWKAMMDKYGNPESYEKTLINSFKKQEYPEIIIVVDKLLTGFDAPRNTVLYITSQLREHRLLQAIARVNRLYPGKDYGYIIDYFGNLENLDSALNTYSGLQEFDDEDLAGVLTTIAKEIEKLPQAHSDLWGLFREVKNRYDEQAYEELLADEEKRHLFYEKLSTYLRLLKLALSSLEFANDTPEHQIKKYKDDAKFFLKLRVTVKRRYSDSVDYQEYELQVRKLIDKHITTEGEVLKITDLVNIFDKEQREAEVERITGKAAKADHIASRTIRAISIKMNEDPVFYKKLSLLIKETIDAYHRHRIDEAEYLAKAKMFEIDFLEGRRDNIPASLKGNDTAIAYFNLSGSIFETSLKDQDNGTQISADIAEGIDSIIRSAVYDNNILIIDWQNNRDIEGRIKIEIDDYLFELNVRHNITLPLDQVDQLIEECLKVAKLKYN